MSELYRDYIDRKADAIINGLGGTITPAPANAELYRDFLDRKFDDVINSIDNIFPVNTKSGNIVTFDTALSMPLVNGEFSIQAYQEGTGDPTPINIRNIVGYNSITITANGTPVIFNIGQTVYGGIYNSVSGILLITWVKEIYNGTQLIKLANWRPTSTSVGFAFDPSTYIGTRPTSSSILANILCNKLKTVSYNQIYSGSIDSEVAVSTDYNYGIFMRLPDPTLTTSALINQYLSNNPVDVIYELDEPLEIQLSPTDINTINGQNTISCDTGDSSVSFKQDIVNYINDRL